MNNKSYNGRPAYSEEQYKLWLNLMTPFLVAGNSISYAIIKSGLSKHKTTIYEKVRLEDWFSEKIDDLQKIPGEIANETFYLLIRKINKKVKSGENITKEDFSILKYFSEKHRSSQPFFINKHETDSFDSDIFDRSLSEILEGDYSEFTKTPA